MHSARNRIMPLSPRRLYMMAWRPALLASLRVNHHLISTKESMPTPSQPTNRRNRLLEQTSIIMNSKKKMRQLINRPFLGSPLM